MKRQTTKRKKTAKRRQQQRTKVAALLRTEGSLGHEELRFRIAAQSASDLIYEWNVVTGRLEWFGRIDEKLGYRAGEFPRTIEAWENAIHPDDRSRVMSALDLHLKSTVPFRQEYRIRRKDGMFISWIDRGMCLRDRKGNPTRFIGTCTDITEQKLAEEKLRRRLDFERTLSKVTSYFVGVPSIDDAINSSLHEIGQLGGADRAYVFLFSNDGDLMSNTHEWCARGVTPQIHNLKDLSVKMFPWWLERLRVGDIIRINNVSDIPKEAATERKLLLEDQDIKSLLVLPMNGDGKLIGFIGFDHVVKTGQWTDDDLELLKVSSKIICDALQHDRMDKEIRALARLPSENPNPILRVNELGTIVIANKASDILLTDLGTGVGRPIPKQWCETAAEALKTRSPRTMEIDVGDRSFTFFVMPVSEERYVNFYGRDITDRRRMEKELKQYTQNLEAMVESRTKEIKSLSESVSQRLIQKISQLDNMSSVREKVRQAPDMSIALDIILETVLRDLEMDVGAILAIDDQKNIARLTGFRSKLEGHEVGQANPLDPGFVELEAVEKNKSISRTVTGDDRSLLRTSSVHCAPIHFANKVHGLLAIGGQRSLTLDDSDLTVLALYAELASSVFERQRLSITPAREVAKVGRRRFEVDYGVSYLIKDDVQKAFEIFVDTVLSGVDGLCITREFPPKIRKKHGLEKTPIVWLTEEKSEGHTTVNSLQDVSVLISNFLDKVNKGIVILDGIEYLIMNSGFDSFIRFLQTNRSRFEQHESILIAPLLIGALDGKQVRLIERETTSFGT